jgi:hypothetical protein
MCPQHEQATPGKRGDPPAHQFPEPSLYPVANHRRANRTANYKAYLRLGVLGYRTGRGQQVSGQRRATGPPARAHGALELRRAPHPRFLRQHDPSNKGGSASWPAQIRRRAARGPCGGVRQGQRGRRGYASARGSRGPSPADGCSAGTYACSLELQSLGKLSSNQGQACRALLGQDMGAQDMAQPVNGTGDLRTGQTRPLRSVKDHDFHNVSTAGDLGCGKSTSEGRLRGLAATTVWGNRTAADVHTCGRTCGQRVAVSDLPDRTYRGPGHDCEARGAIGD